MTNKHPQADCANCPLNKDGSYVPPEVHSPARYVFVGEAPGRDEVRRGRPFTGISGKLLDALLEGNGLSREQAVLTNTVLCRPKGNATPEKAAVAACSGALQHIINEADPEYVVALGKTAASAVLGKNVSILKARVGPPKEVTGKTYKVIPTIHPAGTLRNTGWFPLLDSDITKLVKSPKSTWKPPKWKAFEPEGQALIVLKQLLQHPCTEIVLDLEVGEDKDTDFGHPSTVLCAGITYEPGKSVVIGHTALQSSRVRDALADLLRNKKVVCQNGKYDLQVLRDVGIGTFRLAKDTMLMSYTQNELKGVHGLEYMGQEILGTPDWKHQFHATCGDWPKIIEAVHNDNKKVKEELYRYNAYDTYNTWELKDLFEEWMDEDDHKLHDFLCWVSHGLMIIESEGVKLDIPLLQKLDKEMKEEIAVLNKELNGLAQSVIGMGKVKDEDTLRLVKKNGRFNPNSPIQVKGILSGLLGGTSLHTTDAEQLQAILDSRGKESGAGYFCHVMLEQRAVTKMHGTYVKGWMKRADENHRIRTSYLIHGTETGRLSARNPNVQNPPRGEFRKVVIPEDGNVFCYADFANIEGRIVAVESDDENMQEVLRDPSRDIHGEMAAMIYGPEYDKEQRTKAKTVVHGKNYARTAEGIAGDPELNLSVPEARKIVRAYDQQFPKVKEWQQDIKRRVILEGETLITPWGRKRRFGLITKQNIEDVYKEALAFKPQSIGSDICLTAAIRLREMGYGVRILIHDGIVIELREDEVDKHVPIIRKVMEEAALEYTDKIPFPVDIEIGKSWGDVE